MGAFVLGILFGWLLEWLFFTFWIKRTSDEDCTSFKTELELKNRQISSLQAQLASASEATTSTKGSSESKTTATSTTKKTATQAKSKTSTTKSTAANSASTKAKQTASKTTSKPSAKKATGRKSKMVGDDFTKISGIGPSISAKLKSQGIDTFEKLAATEDDVIRDLLEKAGARLNSNIEIMDSWNEQATVAAKGDFETLKKMQEAIKK